MTFLACFYTNNKVRRPLLEQSLRHFLEAAANASVIPVVSAWQPIPNLPCQSFQPHFQLGQHGHLNILLQLAQVVQGVAVPWDYLAFCEHDCLYPANYFSAISEVLSQQRPPGVASENHLGMGVTGFADCWYRTQPLFGMLLRRDLALASLTQKLLECARNGACCLEPEDRTGWLFRPCDGREPPIIHVNMHTTADNHHLTNHYDFYALHEPQICHSDWGDYRQYGIFTESEIAVATQPVLPRGTYQIVAADYGDFGSGRIVSYLDVLRQADQRGRFHVSNSAAGSDPAPGVVKQLRMTIIMQDTGERRVLTYREGVTFLL